MNNRSDPAAVADERAPTVAIVEDDDEIRALVAARLESDGFDPVACPNADALNALLATRRVDLIVLDIMMPGEDGLSVCRRIAPNGPPIILLSARGEDVDRIIGLELGADDYLSKPFNPRELSARIRSVLRRAGAKAHTDDDIGGGRERYEFANWRLDVDERALSDPQGEPVILSSGEFSLLLAFVRRPRRVLSRDQLLDWTRGDSSAPVDRAIDVQLSRLRKKLRDDPRRPQFIKTVRGDGYLFAADVRPGGRS